MLSAGKVVSEVSLPSDFGRLVESDTFFDGNNRSGEIHRAAVSAMCET